MALRDFSSGSGSGFGVLFIRSDIASPTRWGNDRACLESAFVFSGSEYKSTWSTLGSWIRYYQRCVLESGVEQPSDRYRSIGVSKASRYHTSFENWLYPLPFYINDHDCRTSSVSPSRIDIYHQTSTFPLSSTELRCCHHAGRGMPCHSGYQPPAFQPTRDLNVRCHGGIAAVASCCLLPWCFRGSSHRVAISQPPLRVLISSRKFNIQFSTSLRHSFSSTPLFGTLLALHQQHLC